MKIAVESELPRLYGLAYHLFNSHYLRIMSHIRSNPLAIQISTRQATSIVANYDTIRVQHGHDLENISIS
jgi:hypothetical protein